MRKEETLQACCLGPHERRSMREDDGECRACLAPTRTREHMPHQRFRPASQRPHFSEMLHEHCELKVLAETKLKKLVHHVGERAGDGGGKKEERHRRPLLLFWRRSLNDDAKSRQGRGYQ